MPELGYIICVSEGVLLMLERKCFFKRRRVQCLFEGEVLFLVKDDLMKG